MLLALCSSFSADLPLSVILSHKASGFWPTLYPLCLTCLCLEAFRVHELAPSMREATDIGDSMMPIINTITIGLQITIIVAQEDNRTRPRATVLVFEQDDVFTLGSAASGESAPE